MPTPATSPAHTPGPWTQCVSSVPGNGRTTICVGQPFRPIASTAFAFPLAVAEANARFIAAAPKMLERLKMSLADAETMLKDIGEDANEWNWQSIADDLRAVIAEATEAQ